MYVRSAREDALIDLNARTDHKDLPGGPLPRDPIDQIIVEALIYHADISQARRTEVGYILGNTKIISVGLCEVAYIYAATIEVRIAVVWALGFEKPAPASEDHICSSQQASLALTNTLGCKCKLG